MRCHACGFEVSVLNVESTDLNKVRGFELHTVKCKQCGLLEKRLTFNSELAFSDNSPASQRDDVRRNIGDILGRIGEHQNERLPTTVLRNRAASYPKAADRCDRQQPEAQRHPSGGGAKPLHDPRLSLTPTQEGPVPIERSIEPSIYAHAERAAVGWMQVMERLASEGEKSSTSPIASPAPADRPRPVHASSAPAERPGPHEDRTDAPLDEPPLCLANAEGGARVKNLFETVRAKIRRYKTNAGIA